MATSVENDLSKWQEELANFSLDPTILKDLKLSGFEDPATRGLLQAKHIMERSGLVSLKPLLPLLLSLKGEPFTLNRTIKTMPDGSTKLVCPGYFPFEPVYRTRMPRRTVFKTGRQVAKSTSLAARGIIHSACVPFFTTLYITPLFEMVRRFSQNYVGPFIDQSPVKRMFTGSSANGSVLQRSFVNHSKMIFSFAFLTADRTRGVSADKNSYDEAQDLDKEFIPIITETMSGSPYKGIWEFAGTPKSLENTMEGLWGDSSQAEWVIKCHRCGYWNVPALAYDLEKMIGPYREDISFEKPATICAKCRRCIYPHTGRWIHGRPEKRWDFAGLHIPQQIMPMHYGDPEKWSLLLGKREGKGNTPANVYFNEVCGESYDTGSRIITLTELRKASVLPWSNTLADARPENGKWERSDYLFLVLACDWGGGGEDGVSFTVFTVMGMRPDGSIDVIFSYRSLTPHDHVREARLALGLANAFKCQIIAHDYTGAGSLRETFIVQAGYPLGQVLPIAYVRAASQARIMLFKGPNKQGSRAHYQIDKTRSLLLTCNQIKCGQLRFFKDDYNGADDQGLIRDFLALVDEKVDSRLGKDIYTIIRDPNLRDDFAQTVNIGACALWHMSDKWPDVAAINALTVPRDLLNAIHPMNKDIMLDLL